MLETEKTPAGVRRRDFLAGAAAAGLLAEYWSRQGALAATVSDIPIIDTHIHLFDATRPQGAPYTGSRFYKGGVSTPAMYRPLAEPNGIVGAIVMEASRWVEDNLWVLDLEQTDTMMVGFIGDLEPDKPEFNEYLDRYRKNPLWRGIRYGNNWGFNLADMTGNQTFMAGLKRVADDDLAFDVANPRIDLMQAVIRVNDAVPNLRIILDHMPQFEVAPADQATYDGILKEFHARPNIICKLSEIDHRVGATRPVNGQPGNPGTLVSGLEAHKARLDMFMDVFGEDRVVFGTDYPNSVGNATPAQIVAITRAYFAGRTREAAEKFFWKNAARVYKYKQRDPKQPVLT